MSLFRCLFNHVGFRFFSTFNYHFVNRIIPPKVKRYRLAQSIQITKNNSCGIGGAVMIFLDMKKDQHFCQSLKFWWSSNFKFSKKLPHVFWMWGVRCILVFINFWSGGLYFYISYTFNIRFWKTKWIEFICFQNYHIFNHIVFYYFTCYILIH